MKEKGQIVIILLLVTVISLSIGLTIAGRSISEISTSTVSENSSRAFSAAEAGLERLLGQSSSLSPTGNIDFSTSFSNASTTQVNWDFNLPAGINQGVEYGTGVNKDLNGVAEFWLANISSSNLIPPASYTAPSFDLYFGLPDDGSNYSDKTEKPAAEVFVISYSSGSFSQNKYYFDTSDDLSRQSNNFIRCSSGSGLNPLPIQTTAGLSRSFYCRKNITGYPINYPVMVRVRILYSSYNHPIAIMPASGFSFPAQIKKFTAQGKSGNTLRTVQIFQQAKVMPFFLDYAVFSVGELSK